MPHFLKLMRDYQCHPLWEVGDVGNVDPADLPLKKATLQRLQLWSEVYNRSIDSKDPETFLESQDSEQATREDEIEGVKIWILLREELHPQFLVSYFYHGNVLNNPHELLHSMAQT